MKGRYYSPVIQEFEDQSMGKDYYDSTFKFPITHKPTKKNKVNTRNFSPVIISQVRYIWASSIPNTWFELAAPSRFYNVPLNRQKHKNTLMFLEETQKYIFNIRKPLIVRDNIKTAKIKTRKSKKIPENQRKNLGTAKIFSQTLAGSKQDLLIRNTSTDFFRTG
jgi:hypothetical protein